MIYIATTSTADIRRAHEAWALTAAVDIVIVVVIVVAIAIVTATQQSHNWYGI